jgi:uncharacterized protein YigE (DUF2233 family)
MKLLFSMAAMVLSSLVLRSEEVREENVTHAGASFRVVRLPPSSIDIVWKNPNGTPYRSFEEVQNAYAKAGKKIRFIMNAGIYEPGGIPSGLHIEKGKQWRPVNLEKGEGNFFLQPNGVFRIGVDGGALISPSDVFADQFRKTPGSLRLGIQSGPLLLTEGRRHPAFREGSPNKLLRNGVGVDSAGRVVFAITAPDQMVNLWDFAGLFLKLDCKDALFLDGDISMMAVNPVGPLESNLFGAMFIVTD